MMQVVNTYHIYPDLDDLGAAFLTVLTHSSGDNSFAVYSGVVALRVGDTDYSAARNAAAAKVAQHGNKESFERAVTFYPMLKREEYRG